MTTTEVTTQPTDAERFGHILQVQRAAYVRDGTPSLAARRNDLARFKAALIARRSAIEEAINTDFGHRSRHETAIMEIVGVVRGASRARTASPNSWRARKSSSPSAMRCTPLSRCSIQHENRPSLSIPPP
jgi:hypothetical protein